MMSRYLNEGDAYYGGFERGGVTALLEAMKSNFSSWVPGFAAQAIGVNDIESIEKYKKSLGRMIPKVALDVAETVFFSDLREVLRQLQVPCTIIQSEEDFAVPKTVAYYMKQQLGGESRVEILPGRGHVPQLTNHHMLLDVLKRVLAVEAKGGASQNGLI